MEEEQRANYQSSRRQTEQAQALTNLIRRFFSTILSTASQTYNQLRTNQQSGTLHKTSLLPAETSNSSSSNGLTPTSTTKKHSSPVEFGNRVEHPTLYSELPPTTYVYPMSGTKNIRVQIFTSLRKVVSAPDGLEHVDQKYKALER